jgi:hypothetical protein
MSKSAAIEGFLATGEVDATWKAWRGSSEAGATAMLQVLERVLRYRASGAPLGNRSAPRDAAELLLARVGDTIHGLVSEESAEAVVRGLPERLQVVTVDDFAERVAGLPLDDAWCLANIVLEDMGAPPLSDDAPQLDGICTAQAMWVPPGAFAAPTATVDVLVHEVAHLLHTVDRKVFGLDGDGPVLPVPPDAYETFAYACELWACRQRISPTERGDVAEAVEWVRMADARVDAKSLLELLRSAEVSGWTAIREWVAERKPA